MCCWFHFEDCEKDDIDLVVKRDGFEEEIHFEWLCVCFSELEVWEFVNVWDGKQAEVGQGDFIGWF